MAKSSSSTQLNFGSTVSLAQAAKLIAAVPLVRFHLEGPIGSGKSSIMYTLRQMLGDELYAYAYIDCAQKDLGDISMPVINRELRVTEYFTNAGFQFQTGKRLVIMLDEFDKAPQPVQNMLHPLLEKHNPRLGDNPLPEGSIVFSTSNLSSEGVGDSSKAHTKNRRIRVRVRKPDADEWCAWGIANGINPVVLAWVNRYPHCLAETDEKGENLYIHNPRAQQDAFVSGRSLESASQVIDQRHMFDAEALTAALIGALGAPAARDIEAFVAYQDQLPEWEQIIRSPLKTPVPKDPGAIMVLIYGAVARVEKATFGPFMEYMERLAPEWQVVFAASVVKDPTKKQIAFSNPKLQEYILKNNDIL